MNVGIGLSVSNFSSVPTVALDPDQVIADLFDAGGGTFYEGAWYDPSDLTTLFLDAQGQYPVVGQGSPVGLMLDKSKGGLSATELITNGGFDSTTGWTQVSGTLTISGGVATLAGTNNPDPHFVSSTFPVNGGSWYKISANIISAGGSPTNSIYIRIRSAGSFTGATGIVVSSTFTGLVSVIVQIPAAWTVADVAVQRGGNPIPPTTTLVVDDISVRELPGNHATQATSTARPTLQLSGSSYYLDFDGVDDWMRSSSFPAIAQPVSAASGFRASNTPAFIIDGHDANEFSIITINVGGVDKLRLVSGNTNPFFVVDYTYGGDTVARVLANGASSVIAIDGAETVGAASATAAVTAWTLGASGIDTFKLDGRFYGFVAIDRTLTADEIDNVESYLADKTGFTAPVITGVPTISVS